MKIFGIILSLADPCIHGKLLQQPQTLLEMIRNLNKLAVYSFFFLAKQAVIGHYFAGASLVTPGFSIAQDDCDWFKEIQTSHNISALYQNDNGWSQTFFQC